jgi:hypothetical protein
MRTGIVVEVTAPNVIAQMPELLLRAANCRVLSHHLGGLADIAQLLG